MGMLLIEGTFRLVGSSPDGDSIRFYPDDPAEWDQVGGIHKVRRNTAGGAQLRLDSIDTLETHCPTEGGVLHQPVEFGDAASKELTKWVGFSHVVRDTNGTVSSTTPEETPGYIFTRCADKYGRCVAFVGGGPAPGPSGTDFFVTPAAIRKTANHHQLLRGLAFPTFYRKLFPDLRREMAQAVSKTRPTKGLWPLDKTQAGAKLSGLDSLTNDVVILPKLFRRLANYLVLNDGDPSIAGFKAYLAQLDDRMFILSAGHSTSFDTVVDVSGQTVKLTRPPEDLVFDEG